MAMQYGGYSPGGAGGFGTPIQNAMGPQNRPVDMGIMDGILKNRPMLGQGRGGIMQALGGLMGRPGGFLGQGGGGGAANGLFQNMGGPMGQPRGRSILNAGAMQQAAQGQWNPRQNVGTVQPQFPGAGGLRPMDPGMWNQGGTSIPPGTFTGDPRGPIPPQVNPRMPTRPVQRPGLRRPGGMY